jgi:hypothetical protein
MYAEMYFGVEFYDLASSLVLISAAVPVSIAETLFKMHTGVHIICVRET